MNENLLVLDGVTKHYPVREGFFSPLSGLVRAVDGVDLVVRKGETMGLVGESGCGKSTLARLVTGLEKPTSGRILFEDREIWELARSEQKRFRRRIQMIFQDPYSSLNPRKTIGKIIAEGLNIHKLGTRAQRRQKVLELMDRVGLRPEFYSRYPHQFSGGQRQRAAVARSLTLNPDLMVLDEPVSALDVSIQAQIINLFEDLQDSFGLTYLFISHDLSVVRHISDRVAVMYLGRLVETAQSRDIYADARHPYTRTLLEAVPVPDPARARQRRSVKGDTPSPVNPPSGCRFHPRCPLADKTCSEQSPGWTEVSRDHLVRCHKI